MSESIKAVHELKAIILDRDGVVNEVVFRNGNVASPRSVSEFQVRDDFREFHAIACDLNLILLVASNQPDVARGFLSEDILKTISSELQSQFSMIKEVAYCKHDDADACVCRKPKPGLVNALLERHNLSRENTAFVGDSHKDVLAAKHAGIKSAFLATSYNRESLQLCEPDIVIEKLAELIPSMTGE